MTSCFFSSSSGAGATQDEEEAAVWVPPTDKNASPVKRTTSAKTSLLFPSRGAGFVIAGLVFLALLVGSRWIDLDAASFILGNSGIIRTRRHHARRPHHARSANPLVHISLTCNDTSPPSVCHARTSSPSPSPSSSASTSPSLAPQPPPSCPEYFRYIHSDLEPWSATGITREAVERAKPLADFRLVVLDGRAYVETYRRSFQTRDIFTQWGIVQLLNRYPGRLPDLDLMFNCGDMPVVRAADYPSLSAAPPLFRYCKDKSTVDILFPDWSFWGWPEVNIRPWVPLMEEMKRENERVKWEEREPYAYWKGNPDVSATRQDLLKCNLSNGREWNVRAFKQDWEQANRNGFKESNLAKQCLYRYKIYVEGRAWSVSEKYILACNSPMLLVSTPYEDFFSRGLVAGKEYWPINPDQKCKSIKFAVDWGNEHQRHAKMMGEEGSEFAKEDLSMDYVYDYMLHVLIEYSKLLRYKPTVPEQAVEYCLESIACPMKGRDRTFMMESMEKYVADYDPCVLPPPFTSEDVNRREKREVEMRRKVENMRNKITP